MLQKTSKCQIYYCYWYIHFKVLYTLTTLFYVAINDLSALLDILGYIYNQGYIILVGVGYHLYIVKNAACIPENILKAIKRHVPEVQLESNIGAELSFVLPKEQSAQFESLFADLEQNQKSLGIDSFGVSVTTLEEVFLK